MGQVTIIFSGTLQSRFIPRLYYLIAHSIGFMLPLGSVGFSGVTFWFVKGANEGDLVITGLLTDVCHV
jgi:hypothetical protein